MNNLNEVKESHKDFLTPNDVAPILQAKAYNINLQARQHPELLGFNVCVVGTRVKIPRKGFIRFCEGERLGQTNE